MKKFLPVLDSNTFIVDIDPGEFKEQWTLDQWSALAYEFRQIYTCECERSPGQLPRYFHVWPTEMYWAGSDFWFHRVPHRLEGDMALHAELYAVSRFGTTTSLRFRCTKLIDAKYLEPDPLPKRTLEPESWMRTFAGTGLVLACWGIVWIIGFHVGAIARKM
jgi:hypothetical protein